LVCVTGPLSPALEIRTLTLTFVGVAWTPTGDDVDVGSTATVSGVVSAALAVVSGAVIGSTAGVAGSGAAPAEGAGSAVSVTGPVTASA
jgi:hypothetical protein